MSNGIYDIRLVGVLVTVYDIRLVGVLVTVYNIFFINCRLFLRKVVLESFS